MSNTNPKTLKQFCDHTSSFESNVYAYPVVGCQASQPSGPCILPAAGVDLVPLKSVDGESFSSKLEKFCKAGRALPSVGECLTVHLVHFSGRTELQKWLCLGYVDFAELFRGFGEATIRVREAGCTASEGFDKYAITYERRHRPRGCVDSLSAWH